jgi:hypothetical protein
LFFALALLAAGAACADELKPFQASYTWVWHGLTVAQSSLQLTHTGDSWVYRTKSEPRGIGKMLSERPVQESIMRVTADGVFPLSYKADDGTSSTKRDADVKFDWDAKHASGMYEDAKVDMPISPGIQDDLSIQVALMAALLKGTTPDRFSLISGDSVREYHYIRENEVTLTTAIGTIQTILYRSEKIGSPRVTRFWCAPSLGFIPVKVEQKRKDDVEWAMFVESVKREP